MLPTSRPQTLKQAKRAYRKSGATVRLSASEIAQAERRASLQERADRIKEREARRKANLKKREEKIARERETARRMGRPFAEDKKMGWTVGPSQLSLGDFLSGVQKPHLNQVVPKDLQPGEDKENFGPRSQQEEDDSIKSVTTEALPPRHFSTKPMVCSFACPLLKKHSPIPSAMRIPPPPKPQPKTFEVPDEVFDECFPSNTQIERELSPVSRKPIPLPPAASIQSPHMSLVHTAPTYNNVNAKDLMVGISTQDLDFCGVFTQAPQTATRDEEADLLAQILTQDLDYEDVSPVSVTKKVMIDECLSLAQISTQDVKFSQESLVGSQARKSDSEFADELTDNDLEDLAMEIEVDSCQSIGERVGGSDKKIEQRRTIDKHAFTGLMRV